MSKNNLLEQLTMAFNKNKAKKIIKEIEKIKKQNPNKVYNFIFNEDGTFVAIEKKLTTIEDESEG